MTRPLILLVSFLAAFASRPLAAAPIDEALMAPDTFEIYVQSTGGGGSQVPIRILADELNAVNYGLISLERDGDAVAVFQIHQVIAVLNRTRPGNRTFRIELNEGGIDFRADKIMPSQGNTILVLVDGEVTGMISNNRMMAVVDLDAVVGGPS